MAISSLARPRNLEWHHVATYRTRHVIVITHQESAIITSHLKILGTARQISPGRNHCHSVRSRPYISPTSLPASACQAVLTPKTHGPPIYPSLVRLRGQMSRPFRSQVLQCVPYVSRTQAFKFRSAYLPSGTPSYHKWCPPVGPLSYCVDLLPSHRLVNVSILEFVMALGYAFEAIVPINGRYEPVTPSTFLGFVLDLVAIREDLLPYTRGHPYGCNT